MMKIINQPNKLPYSALMEIYSESIEIAAAMDNPNLQGSAARIQAEQDFYSYLYHDFFSTAGAVCFLWETEGKFVAAMRLEPYDDGMLVTGLETHPNMRGRGAAKCLLAAVIEYAMSCGVKNIYSHVKKDNEISLAVHISCGFERIRDHAFCLDGSCNTEMYTLCRSR